MTTLTRTIALVALLAVTRPARADEFYDTYQAGLAAFKAKDYSNARAVFLKAYDIRPEPILLYNIAQTYRLESNATEALVYYKRFLAESKIAEDLRNEAQKYVTELEAQAQKAADQQQRSDATGPTNADGTPARVLAPPMDRPTHADSVAATKAVPADDSDDTSPSETPHENTGRRTLAFAIGGGGIALAGGALALELSAESTYDKAKAEQTSQSRRDSLYSSANTQRYAAEGMAIVGIAAVGVGVWLYFQDRATKVVPIAARDSAGVVVLGRF
jgi:tetratricopeptide (TPR) repeat protein